MNHFECPTDSLHYSAPYDKLYNFGRLMMFIERHKGKYPRHGLLAAFLVHFLHKNIDAHFHTGISNRLHTAHELDNGPRGNGMGEIDAVGRDSYAAQPGKPRRGNECNLVHHRQRRTAEKGVVVVGVIRENGFKNAGFRGGDFFF